MALRSIRLTLLGLLACQASSAGTDRVTTNSGLPALHAAPARVSCGKDGHVLVLTIKGKSLRVSDSSGHSLIENHTLLRERDETPGCPSEGFFDVEVNGRFFTVEQQNCSGWDFIEERITFECHGPRADIRLHKLELRYTDRREPDRDQPVQIYGVEHFGAVRLEDVNLEALYAKSVRKADEALGPR